ncbi:MAG: SGNH/GDSL hydrolase family protein [Ilumatobacteraceae bacterium]
MSLTANLAVLTTPTETDAAAAAPWIGKPIDVLALGDSYTAGNGADGIGAGDEYEDDGCLRSAGNYAAQFYRGIGSHGWYLNRACSGNHINQLYSQVDSLTEAQQSQVDLVFLSAGGNDAGFTEIAATCFSDNVPLITIVMTLYSFAHAELGCSSLLDRAAGMIYSGEDGGLINETRLALEYVASKLKNAHIVLVGYPILHCCSNDLNPIGQLTDDTVRQVQQSFTDAQRVLVESLGDRFDYFDRIPVFAGRENNSPDEEWIYDIGGSTVYQEWFHPTPDGWTATASAMQDPAGQLSETLQLLADVATNLADRAPGNLVNVEGTVESWLVDDELVRHPIPDGGVYECLREQGHAPLAIRQDELAQLGIIGTPAEAWCFSHDNVRNSIIVTDRQAWRVSDPSLGPPERSWIRSEATFRCLEAQGLTVHRNVTVEERNTLPITTPVPYCIEAGEIGSGVIAVDPNFPDRSYLLKVEAGRVVRHSVATSETFACLDDAFPVKRVEYTHEDVLFGAAAGDDADNCLDWGDYVGQILEDPSHRQMLVTAAGQRGVRDGGTSRCLTAWEGRPVVYLDAVYLNSVPADPAGWATCTPLVSPGQILRVGSTGAAYTVNRAADGALFLRHIEEAETYRCLVARGAGVLDNRTAGQIEAFVVATEKAPVCVDAAAFAGKVVKTASGRAELIDAQGVGHLIATGGAYLCLTLWGSVPVHPELFNSEQMVAIADGAPATCTAHLVARNQIVTEPGGHAVFVDGSGIAHNFTSGHAYNCKVEMTPGITVRQVPSHEWQQAFSYGTDVPGCEKIMTSTTGASYFQDAAGTVHWLRNTTSYWCAADKGYRIQTGVSQALVNALPQGGWYADCLSPARYKNTIIRRSDGTTWVVDDLGRRRWIPDGYSFECYRERGYRLAESSLTTEQANSVPEVGRMGYCLAKWQARNTIIRECGGTAYFVDGNANRRWIPDGWTFEQIQSWGVGVLNWCFNWEHVGSLPEVGRMAYGLPAWRFKNTLIHRSDGTVYFVDGNGTRHWVRDWYTVERLQEIGYGFAGWNLNGEQVASLGEGGWHPLMLARWRVRNHVVRASDGTAYFVTSDNRWHWIQTGALYNWLVRRYGLAGTWSWEAVNSIRWEGGWAQWW